MIKQYLEIGQDVTYVDHNKKTHKATITTVYSENSARVEFKNGVAIAELGDNKSEPNTFHFEPASPKAEQPTEAKK